MNRNGTWQNLIPFQPRQLGNPGGKPLGARNRLSSAFVDALAADFEQYGQAAIVACREHTSARYLAIIASVVPKKLTLEPAGALGELSDDELHRIIGLLDQVSAATNAKKV